MKPSRCLSESSTTSDNTSEFIDIVKKHDVVYNTHNPDYKNVEVKLKVWSQIADEIGLSIDASKRKWKNLRDSYTKYLRSFRVTTKTSKKYQYWAHAEHMEFLKPYQGPGRHSQNNNNNNNNNNGCSNITSVPQLSAKSNEDDENECDLGYQVLSKATSSSTSSEDDVKSNNKMTTNAQCTNAPAHAATSNFLGNNINIMPMPSLPTVQIPQLPVNNKQIQNYSSTVLSTALPPPTIAIPFSYPNSITSMISNSNMNAKYSATAITTTTNTTLTTGSTNISMPSTSASSSVGCLIIEPHLIPNGSSTDSIKKEMNHNTNMNNLGYFQSSSVNPSTCHVSTTTPGNPRINPPLITKIRRVPTSSTAVTTSSTISPSTSGAINLSFSATSTAMPNSTKVKIRKLNNNHANTEQRMNDVDVSAVLQANKELDANTLFFLSLSRSVRHMPARLQSLAKMRCMRIISDIELELENMNNMDTNNPNCPQISPGGHQQNMDGGNNSATEHFVYVMSPSRVESMIDISSDDECALPNGN